MSATLGPPAAGVARPPGVDAALATATPSGGGVAESADVWLSWRAYGQGDPVLLIMGLMGSGRAWFRLLPHLAPSYRAVVFDNRGTGDSDRPAGLWSMDDLASDALAVMDAAGLDAAHVVGASMGGMVAQHVALTAPERVRSLALLCTHPGRQPGGPPWRMAASLLLRPLLGPARTFPIVAPLLYAQRTRQEHPERLREDLELRFKDATPFGTAPGQLAAIVRHDTRERLSELTMPTLVLHGEEDRLVSQAAARELAERIPAARLVLLPECGHVLTTDAEPAAAAALLDFLASA
jgi:pimeloyl-ACP methyl ester carboxylesterase